MTVKKSDKADKIALKASFDGYYDYERDELVRLAEAAARKAGKTSLQIDANELEASLGEILVATGLCFGEGEAGIAWSDAVAAGPSHQELRDAAVRAAEAENPLDLHASPPELRARLGGLMRTRWAPRWRRAGRSFAPRPADIDWALLNAAEQDEVREMLLTIVQFESGFLRKGRPRRNDLDTALWLIGDLFVSLTGQSTSTDDLPANEESHFIRFASIALRAVADKSDRDRAPEALARRWARCKKHLASEDDTED